VSDFLISFSTLSQESAFFRRFQASANMMADPMEVDKPKPSKSLKRKADDTLIQAPKRIKVIVFTSGMRAKLMKS